MSGPPIGQDAAGPRGRRDRGRESGPASEASPRRRVGGLAAVAALLLAVAGCDDQLKYIDTFAFMVDGPAIETYEQQPRPYPEGSVPVDGRRTYTLSEADTALTNPFEPTTENIQRGRRAFTDFCVPCHGESGRGNGPVINSDGEHPRRIPDLPTADLLSQRARGFSDGYLFGMITNGRGIYMPSYRRIPRETRWRLVVYVRHLQRSAADSAAAGAGGAAPAPGGGADGRVAEDDRE